MLVVWVGECVWRLSGPTQSGGRGGGAARGRSAALSPNGRPRAFLGEDCGCVSLSGCVSCDFQTNLLSPFIPGGETSTGGFGRNRVKTSCAGVSPTPRVRRSTPRPAARRGSRVRAPVSSPSAGSQGAPVRGCWWVWRRGRTVDGAAAVSLQAFLWEHGGAPLKGVAVT